MSISSNKKAKRKIIKRNTLSFNDEQYQIIKVAMRSFNLKPNNLYQLALLTLNDLTNKEINNLIKNNLSLINSPNTNGRYNKLQHNFNDELDDMTLSIIDNFKIYNLKKKSVFLIGLIKFLMKKEEMEMESNEKY